jgi:hypothetical protein
VFSGFRSQVAAPVGLPVSPKGSPVRDAAS